MGNLRNYLNCTCHDNIRLSKAEPSNSLVNEYIDIKSNFHIFVYKIQNDDLSQLKKDKIKKIFILYIICQTVFFFGMK